MILKIPISNLRLFVVLLLFANTLTLQATSIKDSFDLLIKNEKDVNKKVQHIVSCIKTSGLSSSGLVYEYLGSGLKLANSINDDIAIQLLYTTAARQLADLGDSKSSIGIYYELDSLYNINKVPSYKGNSLLGLAYFDRKNAENLIAIKKLNEAQKYFNLSKDLVGRIHCLNELSSNYLVEGDIEKALMTLDSAIAISEEPATNLPIFSTYLNLGRVYRQKGENSMARKFYLRALDFALTIDIPKSLSVTYNNLGNIEQITGNLNKAMSYYLKSITIKEKSSDKRGLAIGLHNVGTIEQKLEDLPEAQKYFKKSLRISEQINFKALIIENKNKLGSIYYINDQYLEAKNIHLNSLNLSKEINYKKGIIYAAHHLGKDFYMLGDYLSSKKYLFEALELSKQIKDKVNENAVYIELTQLYIKAKENNSLATIELSSDQIEDFLLKGNKSAIEMENAQSKLDALTGLSSFYLDKHDYKKGANYLSQLKTLSDSIYTMNVVETTKELKVKYETISKENKILKLEQEKEVQELKLKNRSFMLRSLIAFLLIGGIFSYQFVKNKFKLKQSRQKEILRNTLSRDLHDDVGSMLSSISLFSMAALKNMETKPDKVKNILNRINEYSYSSLESMNDIVWALNSENDMLSDMVNRMRSFAYELSEASSTKVIFEIDEVITSYNFDMLKKRNVYLIYKEGLNNAIKYANASKIIITLVKQEENLSLTIVDNGKGFNYRAKAKTNTLGGNGLNNMRARAQQINGELTITSKPGETKINFIWS